MSSIFFYILLAIGLSMDAFSLALAYGTNRPRKKSILILSTLVGSFHFLMPNLGSIIGHSMLKGFILYGNIITGLVFLFLTIQMLLSFKEKEELSTLTNFIEILLFSLAVSVDSFTIGIALSLDNNNLLVAGLIFSIISFIFTFSGLILGRFLSEKSGNVSKVIGVIILFIFTIKYLFNL